MSIEDEALKVLKSVKQMGESVEAFIGKITNELKNEEDVNMIKHIGADKNFQFKGIVYTKTDKTKEYIDCNANTTKCYECMRLVNGHPNYTVLFNGEVVVEIIK